MGWAGQLAGQAGKGEEMGCCQQTASEPPSPGLRPQGCAASSALDLLFRRHRTEKAILEVGPPQALEGLRSHLKRTGSHLHKPRSNIFQLVLETHRGLLRSAEARGGLQMCLEGSTLELTRRKGERQNPTQDPPDIGSQSRTCKSPTYHCRVD